MNNIKYNNHNHLLTSTQLVADDIITILDIAEKYLSLNKQVDKKSSILKGRTLINLFYENSTRTIASFELAGKRMGADVVNIQSSSSSASKGESLIDTAATINAMNPDFITIRHPESGAATLFSQYVECPVINAGDGSHEHPTQALLDAMTIRSRLGTLSGLNIAICGDILHSRVARSNINVLNMMGSSVRLIAPPTLVPNALRSLSADIYHSMEEGLKDVDVIMMLRVQKERMSGCFIPSAREYYQLYGLNYKKLSYANDSCFVMHPGPINRGLEISGKLANDIEKSVILEQVEMGVAVRQAVLELMVDV